jgi:diguanylate cyclase (GGDEF)-like protein
MDRFQSVILVVDDMTATIELLNGILCCDYQVLFAATGQDALAIAFETIPDLILLDIMLPDMNGYDICRQLKKDSRTSAIPVIFVTALDEEDDEAKGLNAGAIDYISKPVSPAIVKARVRNHLELKRYRDLLENQSQTDSLTGIANRRKFNEILGKEWLRAIRSQSWISLIMIDIDLFKSFNDIHGHLAGDNCLRIIAQSIQKCLHRPADLAARYGGEEFACILPETNIDGAYHLGQTIQRKISELHIPHPRSEAAGYVTVSIGLSAMLPVIGQDSSEIIQAADHFLYQAKNDGRNCIRPQKSIG